jgi:hypothetical protein
MPSLHDRKEGGCVIKKNVAQPPSDAAGWFSFGRNRKTTRLAISGCFAIIS